MEPLKIVKDNNPLIRKKSVDVALPISNIDKTTILNMMEFLINTQDEKYREKHKNIREGIGLAAPQIGILKKMLVIHFFNEEKEEITHALINPKIISSSSRKCYLARGEGCLSVDEVYEGLVFRDYKIKVSAYDAIKDKNVEIKAKGLEAIVLQHEIDHLYGILFYDRINKFNKDYIPENAVEI